MDLEQLRARRWWHARRRIGSIERAAAFIDDLGFALLFPKAAVALPSLWEAASDRPLHDLPKEWGPDIERVWGWKDELPRRRLAWYGPFLRGRPSFLSPAMLADLYPRAGRPDDFEDAALGGDGRKIARVILRSGPLPAPVLRRATGLDGKRGGALFSKALSELGRNLVLTHDGTDAEGSGWPSAVYELTARAFDIRRPGDRTAAARRFLQTVIAAKPQELAAAFGWPVADARSVLDDLTATSEVERDGPLYRAVAC